MRSFILPLLVLASACEGAASPRDTSPPTDAEADVPLDLTPNDVDADSDAVTDADEADLTDTTWVPDNASCHTDCFGGATCVAGVVQRLGYGPKPCDLGPGCEIGQTYTCKTGCRAFSSAADLPDPMDFDLPLSEYCEGENVLPIGDWLAACDPGADLTTYSGAAESTSCQGGLCLYAVLPACRYTGCTNRCATARGCPEGGRCNRAGFCEPGDPSTTEVEPPAGFTCPVER